MEDEASRRLAERVAKEYGEKAVSEVLERVPITDDLSVKDVGDLLKSPEKIRGLGEEGRLIVELLRNEKYRGPEYRAVLAVHMLRVIKGMGSLMGVKNDLGLDILIEAQTSALMTLLLMCTALEDVARGGNYSDFDTLARSFIDNFSNFSQAADEKWDSMKDDDSKEKETPTENNKPTSDPSGYVYEAVPGNRLQGAEVSLYCEDDISQAPLLWDAVAYGQEARQVTGADGTFGWDVPDGRWQVRCTMAGYEPYVGEWLDVPPEHTDVGVAMVCREAPRVAGARVRDGEVLLSFSRYMVPESVGGLRLLDAGGAEVPFELEWRAEEGDGGRAYAREYVLRLRAEPQAGPYTLRASGRETSYAGVCMEAGDTAVS